MILVPSMEKLSADANTTSSKFRVPPLFPRREALDSQFTRLPVDKITVRDRDVMMRLPERKKPGLNYGIVA